jgi:hypothetical protein
MTQATTGEIVARLRADALSEQAEIFGQGYRDGQEWATSSASWQELKWLRRNGLNGTRGLGTPLGGISDWLAEMRLCHGDDKWSDGNIVDQDAYLNGFVDGASDILSEIEPLL